MNMFPTCDHFARKWCTNYNQLAKTGHTDDNDCDARRKCLFAVDTFVYIFGQIHIEEVHDELYLLERRPRGPDALQSTLDVLGHDECHVPPPRAKDLGISHFRRIDTHARNGGVLADLLW